MYQQHKNTSSGTGFTPYHFCCKSGKGFTLIELLVVIAIISVLSSIVLVSLNSTRGKGGDAAVKANLATLATQASVYFLDNQHYTTGGGSSYDCEFAPVVEGGESMLSNSPTINAAIKAAAKAAGKNEFGDYGTCWITQTGYYAAYFLPSKVPSGWCVDGVGNRCEVSNIAAMGSDAYNPTCQCVP